MKLIVTVHKSDGNETVGEMWTETHIFNGTATLAGVVAALGSDIKLRRRNITLTLAVDQTYGIHKPHVLGKEDLPF